MTKVISIDEAKIDVDNMQDFLRRAIGALAEADAAKDTLKNIVKEAADETKLDKKALSKWFKARYNFKTQEITKEASVLGQLDSAVDN